MLAITLKSLKKESSSLTLPLWVILYANGEGSICKRKDGRYMRRYTVDGKRKTVYGSSHTEVRKKLTEILNDIAKGDYIAPQKDTVEVWMREWLFAYALPTVKQSTYISYEGYVRIHIVPELGNMKLSTLKAEHLQQFFKNKFLGTNGRRKLSPKSLKNIYNMLNESFNQAIANRIITSNPLIGVKLPKQQKPEIRVLDTFEQQRLQNYAAKHNQIQAFGIIFDLSTGIRLGELIGLRWSDVNFIKHSIKINRTVGRLQRIDENGKLIQKGVGVKTTELVIRTPKSDCSKREIPLFDEIWNGLMEYRKKQQIIKEYFGEEYNPDDYIFCNPQGNVYDPRTYEDLFKRCLKEAAIENTNFHALRHTFATRALEAGMDIEVLSTILGHAQPSTTLNMYGHALPDHKIKSMAKMSQFYTLTPPESDAED